MNTEDYRQEYLRLLGDSTYYAQIDQDPTARLQVEIRGMIEEAYGNTWISQKEAEFLDAEDTRTPYFYCLPKIHKGNEESNWTAHALHAYYLFPWAPGFILFRERGQRVGPIFDTGYSQEVPALYSLLSDLINITNCRLSHLLQKMLPITKAVMF
ncbi:hypothetical protein NDU88_001643 [Pleurodeles waltl]|uniref:Uncharacterized protein n=1 Tax=Pleurodeles waltl TaxID=8319 RepID=A0AAV7VZJ2_PLEWA|nr:hypothetical protein NDU88_001643 [Pleurodeles waltl]